MVIAAMPRPTLALDNGLGRVPPMGWASWNTFVDVALNESVSIDRRDNSVLDVCVHMSFVLC